MQARLCVALLDILVKNHANFLQQGFCHKPVETIVGSRFATLLVQIENCPQIMQEHRIFTLGRDSCFVLGNLLLSGQVSLSLIETCLSTQQWENIFQTLGRDNFVLATKLAHQQLDLYKMQLKGFEILVLNICTFLEKNGFVIEDLVKWNQWLLERQECWGKFLVAETKLLNHWPIEVQQLLFKYLDPFIELHKSTIFLNLLLVLAKEEWFKGDEENQHVGVTFSMVAMNLVPHVVEIYKTEMATYIGNNIDLEKIKMEHLCLLLHGVQEKHMEMEFELARHQVGMKDPKVQGLLYPQHITRKEFNILEQIESWVNITAKRELVNVLPKVASVLGFDEDCGGVVSQIRNVVIQCTPLCSLKIFQDMLKQDGHIVLTLFSKEEESTFKELAKAGPLIAFLRETLNEDLRHLIDGVENQNSWKDKTWEAVIADLIDLQSMSLDFILIGKIDLCCCNCNDVL
jgi:hypothetical protein